MISINEVESGNVNPVLENLINRVDNIGKPTLSDLQELLKKNAKVLVMKSGDDVVAHFFTDIDGETLILECMLGKSVNGIDPCVILDEYATAEAKRLGLSKIRINTKRPAVVRKFLTMGFDSVFFTIEKSIQ